jgi:transposase-like protein
LHEWFPDDAACLAYLERLRWAEGFVCPMCGASESYWRMADGLRRCTACRKRSSATAGTIFAGTRTPLTLWFAACWYVVNQKNGVSALGLQRVLGLGSYETAWAWLHKLRRAMVRPGRDLLADAVEVDETYVGGVRPGKRGRGAHGKAIVVIAVEDRGKAAGRVRMRRVPDVRKATLTDFVLDTVARGAEVHTDAWEGYNDVGTHRFNHVVTNLSASGDPAHVVLPHVHRVASLLKRWLLGTHQGAVTLDQLDYYLDEFTFRFNRRRSRHRGLLFYRLLEQAVQTDPHPLKTLVNGAREPEQP